MNRGGRAPATGPRAGVKRPRDEDEHPQRRDEPPRGPYRGQDRPGEHRGERPTRYDSRPHQGGRGGTQTTQPHRQNGDMRQTQQSGARRNGVSPSDSVRSRKDHDMNREKNERQAPSTTAATTDGTDIDESTDDVAAIDPAYIKKIMGFNHFNTTHDKKVPGNAVNFAVHKTKKSEYRQYMNREGGFNRPLSPSRGNVYAKPADLSNIEG